MRKRLLSLLMAIIMVLSLFPVFTIPTLAATDNDISDMDALTALGIDTSEAPDGFDATSTDTPYGTDVVSLGTVSELYTVGLTNKTAYLNPTAHAATQTPLTDQSYTNSGGNELKATLYGDEDWTSTTAQGVLTNSIKQTTVASGTTSQTAKYTYVGTGTYLTGAADAYTNFSSGSSTGAFKYAMSSVTSGNFDGNNESQNAQVAMVYTTDYSKNGGLYLRIGDADGTYGSTAVELLATSKDIGNPALKDEDGNLVENFAANPYQLKNYLQVATGDWNGDGLDEIAVYVPEYGYSRILVYALQAVDSDKDPSTGLYRASAYTNASNDTETSKWKLVWSYYLKEGTVVSNMASLVSGDVNEDGIPDLAATWGYYYGPSQNKGSTAVVMFGAKGTDMLRSSQQFSLTYGDSNIVRASFAFGDLAGSGTKNLILCGQSDADLQDGNLCTRYVAFYAWDGSSFTSSVYKNFDLFEQDKDGNYTYSAMITGRSKVDGVYPFYSLPLCISNVAVVSEGITAGTSLLYFDSLVIKYSDSGLNIQEAWDNTTAMQDSTVSPKEYVEYSAVAGALTGQTGKGTVATMTQTLSSTATVIGSYTVTGSHEEPIWQQEWYYRNWWYRLWRIKTWYWYISGYQTVSDSSDVNYNVDKLTMGKTSMVIVDPDTDGDPDVDSSYIKRTGTDFSMSLCLANTDNDSSYMKYGNKHYFTYTDPQVLAVIASPPYFADLLGRDDLSGNYAESTTSYSSSSGSSSGSTTSCSINAGVYVAVEQEFSVFGVVVAKAEAEASITGHFTWDFENTSSLEQTVTYNATSGEDMIAFYSIPMEIYEYTTYVANGGGGYDEVITTVNKPHEAAVKLLGLYEYESIAGDYDALPQISGTILTHDVGDPSTYPSSTDGYDVIAQYTGTPAAVGYSSSGGGDSITQEITMSKEESSAFTGSVETEFKAGAGAGGVTVGVVVGAEAGFGKVETTTNGSSFSGDMQNMPIEAQAYGYAMNWKIFCYKYQQGDLNFPIVNYLVTEYTMPPELPVDFEQDVADTTPTSATLTWTYDKLVSKFNIYRYYEFPDGSGSYQIVSVPMTAADSYDAETGTYYFSYTDTNLSPYTDYQYQIQTVGTGTQSNVSIYSEALAVRTKTETGYPDITLQGLNNGVLLLYPDASSTVTAAVADPEEGEYKGLNYQWQKLENGEWTSISGAESESYTFSNSGSSDAVPYRCRVNAIFYSYQSLTEYQISAYSDAFNTDYSRRTPAPDLQVEVSGTTLTPSIKLWSANAGHTAAPTGTVTFTVKSTDYEYSRTVDLTKSTETESIDGVSKYYSTASFDLAGMSDGVYTVTAYYSGSRVFKSLSIDDGELAIIGSGSAYRLDIATESGGDPVTSFTYGDTIYPMLNYICKDAGGLVTNTDKTNDCTLSYSLDGTNYYAMSPGSMTPNAGSYIMKAVYGTGDDAVVTTQDFTVAPKAITVTIPDANNVSAGTDVVSTQPVPTLAEGCSMAGTETLDDLNLTYTAYNSAGTATPLDADTTPGNYTVIACMSAGTDDTKYANYNITYTSGVYTIIGVTHPLTIAAADFTDSNGTRSVGTATIKDAGASGNYSSGTTVTMQAYPDAGFEVSKWEAVFADSTKTTQNGGATFYLATQAQAVSVTVTFKASVYTLSTSVSPSVGGTIFCDAGSFSNGAYVSTGAKFTFTATPAEGYSFGHWELSTGGSPVAYGGTDNGDGTNSYTVTVGTASSTLYAVFLRDSYMLNLSGNIEAYYWNDDDGLASTPNVKTFIADGTDVTGDTAVTVQVKTGYSMGEDESYYINGETVTADEDGTFTFIITQNTTVSLETDQGSFSVSAYAKDALGSVVVALDDVEQSGTSLTDVPGGSKAAFTAKAVRGYVLDYWSVKIGTADAAEEAGVTNPNNSNTLTIAELGANTEVTAVFKENTAYTFNASVSNTSRGTLTYTLTDIYGDPVETDAVFGNGNDITVYNGESVKLTTVPVSGSMVEQWLINGSATATYDTVRSFSNISRSYTVIVYLKASTGYKVSYDSGDNGGLTAMADDAGFTSGDVLAGGSKVVFTATPESSYMVDHWTMISGLNSTTEVPLTDSDNVNIVDPVYTIGNLNGHYAVKAYFTEVATKNVSISDITGGSAVITYMTPIAPTGTGVLANATSCDVRTGGTVKLTFTADAANDYATDATYLKNALMSLEDGLVVNVTQKTWGKSYEVEIKNVTSDIAVTDCNLFYTPCIPVNYGPLDTGSGEDNGSVTAKVTANGVDGFEKTGDANSSLDVYRDAQVVFTAQPDAAYKFVSWTINSNEYDPDNPPTGITVNANTLTLTVSEGSEDSYTIEALFEYVGDTITYSAGSHGGISVNSSATGASFESGTKLALDSVLTFTAQPDDGYIVEGWYLNSIKQDGETENEYTYNYLTDDNTGADITVKFIRESYTVTYSAENGSISGIDESPVTVQGDTALTLTATPDEGYEFSCWLVDDKNAGSDNQLSLTITADTDVQAVFITYEDTYTVTFTAGTGGSIGAVSGTRTIISGASLIAESSVTFTAAPDSGYQVKGWKLNGEAVANSSEQSTFGITSILADASVEVEFEPILTYTIVLGAYTHGTVTAKVNGTAAEITDNVLTVSRHDNVVLTAAPSAHYAFTGWGGNVSGTAAILTIADVTEDMDITAAFVAAEYVKFTATNGANGTVTVKAVSDGEETDLRAGTQVEIVAGSTVTLTAVPNSEPSPYMVENWTVDGSVVSDKISKTLVLEDLTADTTAGVTFEPYVGHEIPTDVDTYKVSGVTRTPDDTLPATEVRDRGTVAFTVTLNPNYYVTQLKIFDVDCMVSAETTTPTASGTVKSVPNSDGTYTITLSNVTDAININAVEYNLYQKENVEDADISDALKENDKYDTAGEITAAMQVAAISRVSGATESTTAVYDVRLKVKNDEGNWVDADDTDLPAEGVTVILPYPTGITYASASGYNFSIAHLISTGDKAGTIEYLKPTATAEGLCVTVYTLSPFAMGWAVKPTSSTGGGGVIVTSYDIDVAETAHGTITANKATALSGATITLTVKTDTGYKLDNITVTDEDGDEVTVTLKSDGTYSFEMPYSSVTVKAEFSFGCTGGSDCPAHAFTDVDASQWYHEGIDFVIDAGLFSGTSDTAFEPNTAMTRAMLVTVLYRLEGDPNAEGEASFADAASGLYYYKAVVWASENGIVTGYSDGKFGPNDKITREQMAAILYRYAEYKGLDITANADLSGYTDAGSISSYAKDAIKWANAGKLITGSSEATLDPRGYATRAQVAVILMRFCGNITE
ncbi:MAG: S-layer homology domain-containing protein [Oscillospiraceae bacterium]